MKAEYVILTLALVLAASNIAGATFTIRGLIRRKGEYEIEENISRFGISTPVDGVKFARLRVSSLRGIMIRVAEVGVVASALAIASEFVVKFIAH